MGEELPAIVPDAPTGLTAHAGNAQAALNWTAPAFNGGSEIDYYVIYQDGVALADQFTGLSTTITDLTNGHSYLFTISAHNSVGEGAQSAAVSSTPYTVPNAPTGLTAVAGNAQVVLNWTAPAFNGGNAIDYYVVYQDGTPLAGHPAGLSTTITSLTNGQGYSFTVTAHNAAGEGAHSGAVSSTPFTFPNAPTGLTAVAGNAQVVLNWTAPAFNGGSAIDYYIVHQDGTPLASHITGLTTTITSLTNGHSYSFTVSAHNLAGDGAQSAAVSSTPYTVPNAPTGLTAVAGNAQVVLNWTAPAFNGGRAIDYYVVYQDGTPLAGHIAGLTTTITSLTNGQLYSFTVAAHNLAGNGSQSSSTSSTPVALPGIPTGLTAVASNAQVALNWTAPSSNGGSAIDYYILYQDSVDVAHPTGLTKTVTGLTNGQAYSFRVAAHTSAGTGAQSGAVSSTPFTVPNAPTGLTAVAGNAQVSLNWTAPAFNGGSAITAYNVYRSTSQTSGYTEVNSTSNKTYTDKGLTPGQTYWYKVSSVNAAGEGAITAPKSAIPYTVPNAPTGLTAVAGNAMVTLNWTAPTNNGGSTIDYYVIYQGGVALAGHPTGLTATINGLTNGQSYLFNVTAHNLAGEGAHSGSVSSTPYTVPGAPTGLTAVAGNAQVALNWTAPNNNGGGAIDYYIVYQGGVANVTHPTGLTFVVTGLINGQSYSFTVAAHSVYGNGTKSIAVSATPHTGPNPPTGLTAVAGNAQVSLNWTAPTFNGGSAITGYKLYRSSTLSGSYSLIASPAGLTYSDSGLTNGQTYWYKVSAVNGVGEGGQSAAVSSTPYTLPNAPTGLTAVAGNTQVLLNWTAPAFNGGSAIIYYVIYQDGVALTNHPAGLTTIITGLTNGQSYSFTVAAHNLAGNGSKSRSISSTPVALPGIPTGLTAVAGNAQVTLNWTAPSDNGGNTIDYYVIFQDSLNVAHSTTLSATITSLLNGHSYSFTVAAHTAVGIGAQSGAVSSTPYTVPSAPTGLTAHAGNAQVVLNWTAPFNGGRAIDYYTIYQGGVALTGHPTGLTTIITGLTNGQNYSFTVSAHNLAGNGTNSTSVVATPLYVANTLNLKITSPSTGSFNNTGNVLVKWTVTDTSSSVTKMEVSSDGATWITVTGSVYSYTGLHDGPYTIHVRATDAAANVNTTTVTFTVDTVAPSISITSPSSGAYVNTRNVTVGWTATDVTSGVAKTELSADGTNWFIENGSSGSLSMLDGTRTAYVRVTDRAGNVNTATVSFKVDTLAPTVLSKSPTGSNTSMITTVNVTFSEAVNRSATTISIVGVDGNVVWNQNTISFMPSSALRGRSTYNVTVSSRDLAGNVMSSAWSFSTANVGKISGIVHGHDGNVLVNAIVRLIGHSTSAQTEMSYLTLAVSGATTTTQVTTTDAKGAYAFYDVGIGNYTVEVTEPGYETHSTDVAMTQDAVNNGGLTVDQAVTPSNLSDGSVIILAIVGLVAAVLILVYVMRRRIPFAIPVFLTRKKTGTPANVNSEDKRTEPQAKPNLPEKTKERQPDPQVKKNDQGKAKGKQSNYKGKKRGQQRRR